MEQNGTPEASAPRLSPVQTRFLSALLTTRTVDEAAGIAGIGRTTAHRYLNEPEFQAAYSEAKRAAFAHAASRLQTFTGEAVETLRDVMTDAEQPGAVRVSAAKAVIETALKAREQDELTRRLEDIEEKLAATE